MKKIPPDAFDFYFSLGPSRSYQAAAEKYGVTKRAVTNLAKREEWQRRLIEIEAKAREESDRKKGQALEAAQERHMKALRLVFGKGVEALRQMSIDSPADAMRAIRMAIQEERVALGEPTERTAVSIEETIRREYERWMTVADEESNPSSDQDNDSGEAS